MDVISYKKLANPFAGHHKTGDDWRVPPANIPELFSELHLECTKRLRQVKVQHTSTSMRVHGETGSGKTHFITQLRKESLNDPRTVVIRISMEGIPYGRIWQEIQKRMVTDLLTKGCNPNDNTDTGMKRILIGRFTDWTDTPHQSSFYWLFGSRSPTDVLTEKLEVYASTSEIDYDLQQVLPKLYDKNLATLAKNWLLGMRLNRRDLERLDLNPKELSDAELESSARNVVLSLSRLASPATTLVICIDEIEAILTGGDDKVILRSFTSTITDWIHEPGERLFLVFLRPDTVRSLQSGGEKSHLQAMAQDVYTLKFLTWEQCVKVVSERMNLLSEWKILRKEHRDNQFWPLTEEWLRELYLRESKLLTPRHLIKACKAEIARIQLGKPTEVNSKTKSDDDTNDKSGVIKVDKRAEIIQQTWDNKRSTYLKKPTSIHFDSVVEHTLRWLVGICDAPNTLADSIDKSIGDVNLIFKGAKAKNSTIAVSLCDHDLRSLWQRLKRLVSQQQKGKADKLFDKLYILRAKNSRMTDTAKGYLDQLERGGATIYYLEQQQLVELATYHYMQTHMQKGEYTFDGKPVDAAVFNQWAKENLSSSVKEFAQSIFDLSNVPTAKPVPQAKVGGRQAVASAS